MVGVTEVQISTIAVVNPSGDLVLASENTFLVLGDRPYLSKEPL